MNTAGGVCLSVLSSFLAVAGALAAASALALVRLSALAAATSGAVAGSPSAGAEGPLSPAAAVSSPCSSLVAGVLYGSFSLRELFPARLPGCSWSLENPDPTKYSLYLRFTRHPSICQTHSPMLLSLDHHLANQSCPLRLHSDPPKDQEVVDLCGGGWAAGAADEPYSFLQFDKNFVQLCLTRQPPPDQPPLAKETLELRLVEVLLINNENSSQFTCGVLCRWFEECLRSGRHGDDGGDGCGMTQTGCICPNHNIAAPVPLPPATPHAAAGNGSLAPEDCCVTELHSNDAIAIAPRDVRQGKARLVSAGSDAGSLFLLFCPTRTFSLSHRGCKVVIQPWCFLFKPQSFFFICDNTQLHCTLLLLIALRYQINHPAREMRQPRHPRCVSY